MTFLEKYFIYCDSVKLQYTSNGNALIWRDDLGIGYLPSNGYLYSSDYWETYQQYEAGSIGEKLTTYRSEFVSNHFKDFSQLCDIGIGSGQFVKHVNAKGYDINPYARSWLEKNNLFADPYKQKFSILTFWDVLEHFENPQIILSTTDNVFLSMPIHKSFDDCIVSKHLKPNEHIWHFTHEGIQFFMNYYGFNLVEFGNGETTAGRESIMSYYFNRPINTVI